MGVQTNKTRKCSKITKRQTFKVNIQIPKAFMFSLSMKNQILNKSRNIKSWENGTYHPFPTEGNLLLHQKCKYTVTLRAYSAKSSHQNYKEMIQYRVLSKRSLRANWSSVKHSPPAFSILALTVIVNLKAHTFNSGTS